MTIIVNFRGPMLFVTEFPAASEADDVVDRVIIPDSSVPGEHPDRSPAIVHTPGLLVINGDTPPSFIPLHGRTVVIRADGETGSPGVDADYLAVPPLHEMTNPPGTPQSSAVRRRSKFDGSPVTITFEGGRMTGTLISESGVEIGLHLEGADVRPLCSMPVWQSEAAHGTIELSGGGLTMQTIDLHESVEVFIFNWDEPTPNRGALMAPFDSAQRFQDNDFKWLYQLLEPPTDSWTTWLGADQFLPAPRSRGFLGEEQHQSSVVDLGSPPLPPSPPVSTCDPGRVRGLAPA